MSDEHKNQEPDSQKERIRITHAEFTIAIKELTRLANAHGTEIAVLKEQHRTMEAYIHALESIMSQIRTEVITTRTSVSETIVDVQIAVANHITNDERAQKIALRMLLCFLVVNVIGVISYIGSAWIQNGMPWPIFPWL